MGTRSVQRLCRLLAVIGLGLAVLAPVAAWAQTDGSGYPNTPTTGTTPVNCANPANRQVCGTSVIVRAASTSSGASSGTLAFTGGNIALLVGLGLVTSVGGVVLVRLGRRANATR
jgi:hypothetical protein